MTTARSPVQPALTTARGAGPAQNPGRPLPAAGPGHKGQEAPAPRRGPGMGRDLTWPSPRHALRLGPLTTAVREPGQGQCRGGPPQAALATLGAPHSWPDPKPPGAAIFLHSNAAARAALAWRRQRGARMRRARRGGRARALTHVSSAGPRGAAWGRCPFGKGRGPRLRFTPDGTRPLKCCKAVLLRPSSFGL